jgi:regulator of nucleoside diphosphate kinase
MTHHTPIHLTSQDVDRLERLVASVRKTENILALEEQLEHAVVVPPREIPNEVATMNSRVRFRDEDTGEEDAATIVYPSDAEPSLGRVSVLAPVGSALLGLTVGDLVDWPVPRGRSRRLRIISIDYQPEAAGDLSL